MAFESPVPRSAAGIVEDSESHSRRVPTTVRSDGTARKELKIRPGFTPLEDVGRFRSPRVAQRAAREGSPQLGGGLGGRSLESWANDASKDQGMQASPLRGGGPGSRSTPSSFRPPPVFPSLSALGDALPTTSSSSSRINEPAPHQAPLDPSTSSAPSSPPPRRPWPSRTQPSSSTDTNSIASTPPTRPSSPPPPPLHAPHAMVTDTLEQNKAPPSPASYSKTRRTKANGDAPSSSSQQPHTVQSDWNAAKHCFTAPPIKPQQHRRTSSSSAGTVPSQTAGAGGASSFNAPPSSFHNTVPKRRGQGHGRSNSSTSSNTSISTSNKIKPSTSTSPSIPQSPPQHQRTTTSTSSSSFSSPRAPQSRPPVEIDLISPPAPSPIDSPPLIIVKLPPSRIKLASSPPVEQPPLVLPASAPPTTSTFNNKPIPTGPRNPGPPSAPVKRVGGSWGAPSPSPAPAAAPTPSSNASISNPKPTTLHLLSTPTPPPSLPTPSPAPSQLPLAPLVPSLPPPTAPPPTTRPPRAKSAGGTWGLQASISSSSPILTTPEPGLEVAVHLPPSEAKLVPPQQVPRVSVPARKKNGHKRGNSSVSTPANGSVNVPKVVELVREVEPVVAVEKELEKKVVEPVAKEREEDAKAQELDLPVLDDPAAWGVPLSGRSWADDDDSF